MRPLPACHPDPHRTAYVADVDGNMDIVDVRTCKTTQQGVNLHDKRINTLSLEPLAEHLLATSSSDNSTVVFDVRHLGKGGKPVCSASHAYTCQSAYFAPDGACDIGTTCRLVLWALLLVVQGWCLG